MSVHIEEKTSFLSDPTKISKTLFVATHPPADSEVDYKTV